MKSQDKVLITLALIAVVGGVVTVSILTEDTGRNAAQSREGDKVSSWSVDAERLAKYPRPALPKTNPGMWVTEYPASDLVEEREGKVRMELTIDRFGEVSDCQIKESSGSESFDKRSCAALETNARFYPARDDAGKSIESTYKQSVLYRIPE